MYAWWCRLKDVPPNSHTEGRTSLHVMVFRDAAFGRQLGLDKVMRMGPLWLVPIRDQCPYKKRKRHQDLLSVCHVRTQLSASQEECLAPTMLTLWSWTSSLWNCEKIFLLFGHSVYGILSGSLKDEDRWGGYIYFVTYWVWASDWQVNRQDGARERLRQSWACRYKGTWWGSACEMMLLTAGLKMDPGEHWPRKEKRRGSSWWRTLKRDAQRGRWRAMTRQRGCRQRSPVHGDLK